MNAKRFVDAIEIIMQYIKKDLMSKKKQKSKLRMISLQAKKRWMRKYLKKTKTKFNQFYIVALWMNSLKIIIKINKTRILQIYNRDTLNLRRKVYFNKSEKNKNVTTTTMNFNWNKKKCLKSANIALTHYGKLKNLIIIIERLINYCEKATDARNKIYKVYFDN